MIVASLRFVCHSPLGTDTRLDSTFFVAYFRTILLHDPFSLHGMWLWFLPQRLWLSTPTVRFLTSRSSGSAHSDLASSGVFQRRHFSLPHRLSRRLFGYLALSRDPAQFPLFFSFFAGVYIGILGVASLGLPAHQYQRSSWLHAPCFGLGRPRSQRWCFQLFGGR